MVKKLLSLNLALILMLCLTFGTNASAVTLDDLYSNGCLQAEGVPTADKPVTPDAGNNSIQADTVQSSTPQLIRVGGNSFYSNTDSAGSGWSYSAADGVLTLNNYTGTSIITSADLVVYSTGTVTVTGSSPQGSVSFPAVQAGGLQWFVFSGTTTLTGGKGTPYGGDGVLAARFNVYTFGDSANFVCSGGTGGTYGGFGIVANSINLYTQRATISGGYGPTGSGSGIYYGNDLYVGLGFITIQAGAQNRYAIIRGISNPFYFSIHADIWDEGWRYTFSPKQYTLTLDGAGGTKNGLPSAAVTQYYPCSVSLADYIFSRSGFAQSGWTRTTASGTDLIGLGDTYSYAMNTTLKAEWAPVTPGTILFLGNGGLIGGKSYSTTPLGAAIHILNQGDVTRKDAYGTPLYLLGWSTQLKLTANSDHMLNDGYQWYLPGMTASSGGPLTVYAQWTSCGNIIHYDGNGGLNSSSSPSAVQAILSTGSNLSLYVKDNLGFQKSGYTFLGWRDSAGVSYTQGQPVDGPAITSSLKVTDLKAQWAKSYTLTIDGNGGTYNGGSASTVPTYEGKAHNLALYDYQRTNYTFSGWNTKKDGSGTSYAKDATVTMTGDLQLYAQWVPLGTVYKGQSDSAKDSVSCMVIPSLNKVAVSVTVTSISDVSLYNKPLPVYYALYKNGRLLGVVAGTVSVTGAGASCSADVPLTSGLQPDSCKVFVMDTAYAPAVPQILCLFQ